MSITTQNYDKESMDDLVPGILYIIHFAHMSNANTKDKGFAENYMFVEQKINPWTGYAKLFFLSCDGITWLYPEEIYSVEKQKQ